MIAMGLRRRMFRRGGIMRAARQQASSSMALLPPATAPMADKFLGFAHLRIGGPEAYPRGGDVVSVKLIRDLPERSCAS